MINERVPEAYINRQYNCAGEHLNSYYLDAYFEWLDAWPDEQDSWTPHTTLRDLTGTYDSI